MNYGRAGVRAGDAFGDDRFDRVGDARLERTAPGAVERRFDPHLARHVTSMGFLAVRIPCTNTTRCSAVKTRRRLFGRNANDAGLKAETTGCGNAASSERLACWR